MEKEEPPYGYIKAYNPILFGTIAIATILTLVTTLFCIFWYFDENINDRMMVLILLVISFGQMNVTIGLWYLTYKYAKISEEPLVKLRKLAVQAETAIEYFDILLTVFRPGFAWLKEMWEKGKLRPMTAEEINKQIETLKKKLDEMKKS